MADKVSAGQSLSASPLHKASFVNDLVDVVADHKTRQTSQAGQVIHGAPSTDCVKVKNLTGGNRALGHVVQLGDYLLSQPDPRNLFFEGNTVDLPVDFRYAILRQPIKSDEFGLAQASGVCMAWVDVADSTDTHAIPVEGEHHLESAQSGPIELLQPPAEGDSGSSTGLQLLAVRLCAAPGIRKGKTRHAIPKGAMGQVRIWAGLPGMRTETDIVIEAQNDFGDVGNGAWVAVAPIDGGWDLVASDCETDLPDESSGSSGGHSSGSS